MLEAVEELHAFRPRTEFSKSLRTPQEQDTEQRGFARIKVEMIKQVMPVFRDARARAHDHRRKLLLAQAVQSGFNGLRVVADNGITVGGLIACCNEAIEGQGIILWRDPLFLKQTAEDSGLNEGQSKQGHRRLLPQGARNSKSLVLEGSKFDMFALT